MSFLIKAHHVKLMNLYPYSHTKLTTDERFRNRFGNDFKGGLRSSRASANVANYLSCVTPPQLHINVGEARNYRTKLYPFASRETAYQEVIHASRVDMPPLGFVLRFVRDSSDVRLLSPGGTPYN